MNWFRMYSEARNDAKLRSLSDAQHRVWFNLLCFANEQEQRGSITGYDEELLAVEVAGGDVELLKGTIERLQRLRILSAEDGEITFINFKKRNYDKASDTPDKTRERKQRQREKEKEVTSVTPGHAMSRDVTPHTQTNRLTDRLTDPETDKDLSLTTGQSPAAADKVSGKVLIAELTKSYREVEGVSESRGDHAFIGALYNEHGYQRVLSAINKLQMAAAVQEIEKPLIYLKGILQNKERDSGGQARQPPEQPKVVEISKKRREEVVRAACDFITLNHGPDPPRAQAEEIAREYGDDYVPDIMQSLFGGGP